jgi:hypothetical protein
MLNAMAARIKSLNAASLIASSLRLSIAACLDLRG